MSTLSVIIAADPSAGGAPIGQLSIIAALYWGGTAGLLLLVRAHRRGRTRLLAAPAAAASWAFRAPGWVALPVFLAAVSLLLLMAGGFWDIGYHIDYGRDAGPLGNPGHYPQLFGFFGTFAAGILCLGLARDKDADDAWFRLPSGLRAPVGGVLLLVCAAFGLLALPLDDVWHRIFGQDVTLWSPTHFMLLGGATMSVIAMCVLVAEGVRTRRRELAAAASAAAGGSGPAGASGQIANGDAGAPDGRSNGAPWARLELPAPAWVFGAKAPWARIELLRGRSLAIRAGRVWGSAQKVFLIGGMLVGLEAFLAEYDWGVPLYRQVWQPLLLMAFAGFVFTAARAWTGRGGALGAWGVYTVVRLIATLFPVIAGRSPSVVPLLLAPAICVELAALRLDPRARPLVFGVVAGLLGGTLGFAAEYGWSQLVFPLPWTTALIPEGLVSAMLGAAAGGVLGSLLAAGLRGELPRKLVARAACVGAFAVLIAVGINAGIRDLPDASAKVELTDVRPAPKREALATVRIDPPEAADDVNWLYVLAWQGGKGTQRMVDRLRRVGDGVYRSTKPIPLYGSWKVGLRLQRGRDRAAVPIRLPVDDALADSAATLPGSFTAEGAEKRLRDSAGAELPAPPSFTRPFLEDGLIVLRETKGEVAPWLWGASIGLIALLYLLFITAISVCVARITRRGSRPESPRGRRPPGGAPADLAPAAPVGSAR
jgi:hypothetical protein